MKSDALLTTIGLAAKAGKLIFGTEQICEALRCGKKVFLIIEASDTSENTHKRIGDKSSYYGVRKERIDADSASLGSAVGKSPLAAVGITDEGFCVAVDKKLKQTQISAD